MLKDFLLLISAHDYFQLSYTDTFKAPCICVCVCLCVCTSYWDQILYMKTQQVLIACTQVTAQGAFKFLSRKVRFSIEFPSHA